MFKKTIAENIILQILDSIRLMKVFGENQHIGDHKKMLLLHN